MRKLSIITLAILVIAFGTGIIIFYKKGAFVDPKMIVTNAPAYVVAGQAFKGRPDSKAFGNLFNDAEKLVEEKKLSGTVCGIFYTDPEDGTSDTEAFVGLILKDTNQVLPQGYSKRYVPARKVVQAHIANVLGSPLIYPKIDDYAEENNIKIKKIPAVEMYLPTKEVFIQVPVE